MSDIAILKAIPEYLIDKFTYWNEDNCKAMPDEQPDPMMGDVFASVYITEIQGRPKSNDGVLEERWGFGVTVTKRISAVPYDRITPAIYIKEYNGISFYVNPIKYALNNRWSVTTAINDNIPMIPEVSDFVTDERFLSPAYCLNGMPRIRFAEETWFHGTHSVYEPRDSRDGYTGVYMSLTFGNLMKYTKLAEDTC
jgi:hypothetical protein